LISAVSAIYTNLLCGAGYSAGFLTLFGVIQLWMILVLAFLNGTLLSFDQPHAALSFQCLSQGSLGNAISLQAMTFNGLRPLGRRWLDLALRNLATPATFSKRRQLPGSSACSVCMRVPKGPTHQLSTFQAIRDALGTVRRDAVLPWVLSGYAALLFWDRLPLDLAGVRGKDPAHRAGTFGLAILRSRRGTILGALFLASQGGSPRRGPLY